MWGGDPFWWPKKPKRQSWWSYGCTIVVAHVIMSGIVLAPRVTIAGLVVYLVIVRIFDKGES